MHTKTYVAKALFRSTSLKHFCPETFEIQILIIQLKRKKIFDFSEFHSILPPPQGISSSFNYCFFSPSNTLWKFFWACVVFCTLFIRVHFVHRSMSGFVSPRWCAWMAALSPVKNEFRSQRGFIFLTAKKKKRNRSSQWSWNHVSTSQKMIKNISASTLCFF